MDKLKFSPRDGCVGGEMGLDVNAGYDRLLPSVLTARNVLEQIPSACFLTDSKGYILWANSIAKSLLGLTEKYFAGKPLTVLIPLEEHAKLFNRLKSLSQGVEQRKDELFDFRRRDQSSFVAACSIAWMTLDDKKENDCLVWILRDATREVAAGNQIFKLDEDLAASKSEAHQLREQVGTELNDKNVFIAHLVHEVRTPLQAVIGAAELLECTGLTEKQKDLIESVGLAARQLQDVVNAVLTFTRVELGQPMLQLGEFDLHQMVDDVIGQFRLQLKSKKLYMRKELSPNTPRYVMGDQVRLRQILVNLLSNALNYTASGGISLEVSRFRTCETVMFTVSDTGTGMPDNVVQHLFEPFTNTNRTASRSHGGTAIGLYICKTLVESMGGRIAADSSVGCGTKMIFTVPLSPVLKEPSKSGDTDQNDHKFGQNGSLGLNILVAEDSDLTARIVTMQLASLGCNAQRVINGAQAIEAVQKGQYDVILMDCHMPVLDGLDATRQIRQLPDKKTAQIPIVALTATAADIGREQCRSSGMNAYLDKPVRTAELRTALLSVLSAELSPGADHAESTSTVLGVLPFPNCEAS